VAMAIENTSPQPDSAPLKCNLLIAERRVHGDSAKYKNPYESEKNLKQVRLQVAIGSHNTRL